MLKQVNIYYSAVKQITHTELKALKVADNKNQQE